MRCCRQFLRAFRLVGLAVCVCVVNSCVSGSSIRPPKGVRPREYVLETTGYCPCATCCGWKRNWLGRPVFAAGPNKGKLKKVGYTATGTRARTGTIAADTSLFPFGTIMYVPGYGYGRVEDRGSDIKGMHIDLFFSRHSKATRWGRVKKKVLVWKARRN